MPSTVSPLELLANFTAMMMIMMTMMTMTMTRKRIPGIRERMAHRTHTVVLHWLTGFYQYHFHPSRIKKGHAKIKNK